MPSMGEIVAHLGLNDSKFKAGVNNVGKWSKGKFAAIGSVAAGAFAAAFSIDKLKEIVTAGKDIKIFADQAGISAESFQKLNTVIEKANGDASDTVSIMLDLKRAMADARTGNAQWVKDFESLGISMDMIKKDDPVALFMAIGRTVAKSAELTGEQVNALGRMMGEDTSARAIAAFRNNFEETMKSAITLTQQEVNGLKEIDDAFKSLGRSGMVEFGKFIVDNKDAIIEITRELGKTFKIGVEFFKDVKLFLESASNLMPNFKAGTGTGAGMAMADVNRISAVQKFQSENSRLLEVRRMFSAAEFAPDKLRREELRKAFADAQKEHLELLKQIRDKDGSAAIMGM